MRDAVAAVRAWGNANTSLVGAGNPVALGFFDDRLRSPGRGCYGLVEARLEDGSLDAEGIIRLWRVAITVLSPTDDEAAEQGAAAVADALRTIGASGETYAGARILMAVGITVDRDTAISADEPAYAVQADLYLA